jgi:hypothetical protein
MVGHDLAIICSFYAVYIKTHKSQVEVCRLQLVLKILSNLHYPIKFNVIKNREQLTLTQQKLSNAWTFWSCDFIHTEICNYNCCTKMIRPEILVSLNCATLPNRVFFKNENVKVRNKLNKSNYSCSLTMTLKCMWKWK